ncbi:hypothetical protein PA598K_02708 [Paenibacillus sp. 598K]|nr:hypothetical protein PA598K_02708 [Paenibacillus sp. 598K]
MKRRVVMHRNFIQGLPRLIDEHLAHGQIAERYDAEQIAILDDRQATDLLAS